jgi:hypothetical protein
MPGFLQGVYCAAFSIEVFDADTLGKDKSLGWVEVDVRPEGIKEGWLPLQGVKSGALKPKTFYSEVTRCFAKI